MQSGRTVQGDSTVLSPLSAESWQPLSVLRVQVAGASQPTNQLALFCLHGLQPKAFNGLQPMARFKVGSQCGSVFTPRNTVKIVEIVNSLF